MVSVRRPTPRGPSHGGGLVGNCLAYGKFALLGGIIVFVVNLLLSTGAGDKQPHSILELQHARKDQQMLRTNPDSNGNTDIRKKPPTFTKERLDRRQHEDEDQHPDAEHDVDHEIEKQPEKHQEQEHVQEDNEKEEDNNEERISGDADSDQDKDANEDEGENTDETNKSQKIRYVSPNGEVLEKPEGTGPTKLGFVMDFVHERGHPKFRNDPWDKIDTSRQKNAQTAAATLSESSVQPCEYFSEDAKPKLYQNKICRDPERALVVYNAASFPRTWCGQSIPPKSAARMDDHHDCKEPVHLLERDFPPASGQGMPPIVVHAQPDGTAPAAEALQEVEECSTPCQMEKGMTGIGRYIQGTEWKIYHSDQDPTNRKEIQVELSKYKHDEYYSTPYFKSDIPLSRIDLTKHNLRDRPAVEFESTLDKGIYIVSETCGGTSSRRTRWLETLQNQYHVDSLGKCLNNVVPEAGDSIDTLEGRLAVMKKYKFNLGFEISTHKDWVTELSYEAMLSGAVPVLLGASNANKHFPKNSAIFSSDYNSWDKLTAYVIEVAKNKTLWESYHTWREDEAALAAFERKYQFTKISPECRLCSWAYAKMYGLGWDHELQQVQENYIPRKLCIDEDSGLVVQPFSEVWSAGASSSLEPPEGAGGSCKTLTAVSDKKLEKDNWSVVKSMVQHDSVTDITIHDVQSSEEVTLTFAFKALNNTEGAFFANSHTLVETERGMLMSSATMQDHKSKVTVLANWQTKVWSPQQGLIRIVVQAKDAPALHTDEVRRIRLITEDMGQLHDKMTEYFPSSFSKRVIQDFVDPLEVFYLDS